MDDNEKFELATMMNLAALLARNVPNQRLEALVEVSILSAESLMTALQTRRKTQMEALRSRRQQQ